MKRVILLAILVTAVGNAFAQVEISHLRFKDFQATGFTGFLNFSIPVSDANYISLEGGLQSFKDKSEQSVLMLPVVLGYRYTLNQSGTGLYVEPTAGFTFGETEINKSYGDGRLVYNQEGQYVYESVKGPTGGVVFGYLFEPAGGIQFNVAAKYMRGFGETGVNVFSLRVSHAFTFGRR